MPGAPPYEPEPAGVDAYHAGATLAPSTPYGDRRPVVADSFEGIAGEAQRSYVELQGLIGSDFSRGRFRSECRPVWQDYFRADYTWPDSWAPRADRHPEPPQLIWTQLHLWVLERLRQHMGMTPQRGPGGVNYEGDRFAWRCAYDQGRDLVVGAHTVEPPQGLTNCEALNADRIARDLPPYTRVTRGSRTAYHPGLWRFYRQFVDAHRGDMELLTAWAHGKFCSEWAACIDEAFMADLSCDEFTSVSGTMRRRDWPRIKQWMDAAVDAWWDWKVNVVGQLPVVLGSMPERLQDRPFIAWIQATAAPVMRSVNLETATPIRQGGFPWLRDWWIYALPSLRGVYGAAWHRMPVLGVAPDHLGSKPDPTRTIGLQAGRNVRTGAPVIFQYVAVPWRSDWIWYLEGLVDWPAGVELPDPVTATAPSPQDTPDIDRPGGGAEDPYVRDQPAKVSAGANGGIGLLLLAAAAAAASS